MKSKKSVEMVRREPSVTFWFEKGNTPNPPENFADLKLGDSVLVSVSGKVKSLSVDEVGSNFSVSISKVKVSPLGPEKVSDVMEKIKEQRRL